MPVKSYIAIPKKNRLSDLSEALYQLSGCNVHPAENKEVLVLVTDTESEREDRELLEEIEANEHLQHLSLVSGFD